MARCNARKNKRPLRIKNKFDDGGWAIQYAGSTPNLSTDLNIDVPSLQENIANGESSSFMSKLNDFQGSKAGNSAYKGLAAFQDAAGARIGKDPSMLHQGDFDYSIGGKDGGVFEAVDETAMALQGLSDMTKKKRKPLAEVVGLANGGRLYGGGGMVGNMIQGTAQLVGNAIQNAQIKDTSDIRAGINSHGNVQTNANNYDDLQNSWSQNRDLSHITARDLRDKSVFDDVLNSVSASAKGAAMGSGLSFADGGYIPVYNYPNNQYVVGGIIGGIAGGLSSVVGTIVGRLKARKEAKKVNQLVDAMNNRAVMSYVNNANNIDTQNDFAAQANYAALGGLMDPAMLYQTGDALEYDYLQDKNNLLQEQIDNNSSYASGGKMHINPKNKGKLTATAKRTGKSFSELAHSKNPTTRKRAQFALNARHFNHHKHALGGDLQSNGTDWDLGYTTINNGGTHEMNPNEGVQIGMDNQGIPNLVEEGEVIYNNYVFSNRLSASKELLKQAGLPASYGDMSFAKIAEKLTSESKERPNDPISKRGLDANMGKLMQAQEYTRQQQQADRTKEMINNMSPEELQGLMAMANQGMQQQEQDQAMQQQAAQEQMMAQQGIDPSALGAGALYGAYGGRLGRRYDGPGDEPNQMETVTSSASPANYGQSANEALWQQFLQDNLEAIKNLDWYNTYSADPNAHNWRYWLSDFLANNPEYFASDSVMAPALRDLYTSDYANPQPLVNAPKEGLEALIPALRAFDAATGTSYAVPFADLTPDENGQYAPWFNENGENVNQYAYRIWKESQKGKHPIDISALPSDIQDYIAAQEDNRKGSNLSLLRYASILPQLAALGISARKPNNSYAEQLLEAAQNSGYTPIQAEPIGNYMPYIPIDRNYYTNQLAAQAAAQRRSLINLGNGNRATAAANLLAADYNNTNNLGKLAFDAEQANWQRRKDVGEFNRDTNKFNSQQLLSAAQSNQEAAQKARATNLALTQGALGWERDDNKERWSNIVGNLGQIGQYLSDVGKDTLYHNMVSGMKSLDYNNTLLGNSSYNGFPLTSTNKDAYGGKIRRNRRRRRNG